MAILTQMKNERQQALAQMIRNVRRRQIEALRPSFDALMRELGWDNWQADATGSP